jgi:hypothetical protein
MNSSAVDKYSNIHNKLYDEFCRRFKENRTENSAVSFDAEQASDKIWLELIDQRSGNELKRVL